MDRKPRLAIKSLHRIGINLSQINILFQIHNTNNKSDSLVSRLSKLPNASMKPAKILGFAMRGLLKGKSAEDFQVAREAINQAKITLNGLMASKIAYEEQHQVFCKLLLVSSKELPLSEIIDCIDRIVVDAGRNIVVKWK